MSSPLTSVPILSGYTAAIEKIAHRFRPAGILDLTGADRESFLQGQLTQDVRGLVLGEVRAAAGLTPKGKLLFVARVVGLEDRIRLVLPASIREAVLEHLRKYAVFTKVAIEDRSADYVRASLYGPLAAGVSLPAWVDRLAPERGFSADLIAPSERRSEVDALLSAAGSLEVGDEVAEVLRVEAGHPRFGVDMDSTNLPDEIGMDDAISTTKGCYVGQEVVARLRTYGRVNRRLVSFRFPDGPIEPGTVLGRPDEESPSRIEAGRVTSSVVSPRLGAIGIGFAFRDVDEGSRLISASNAALTAIVEKLDSRIAG